MNCKDGFAGNPEGLRDICRVSAAVQAFWLAVVAVAFLLVFPPAASACSCVGDVPLCQSFWQADAVFSGEVVSFEKLDSNQLFSRRVARIRVERAWRGNVQGTVEVTTGAGGGDCGYSFRSGRKYLVYASTTQDGKLTTGICSPTKLFDKAASDLEYFKEAGKPSNGGRIYGTARIERKGVDLTPAPGVVITLASEAQSRTAVTNERGEFEFTGVPVGAHSVRMGGATTPPWKIELRDARGCVHVNLWAPQ